MSDEFENLSEVFVVAKDAYRAARDSQKKLIVARLEHEGFKVIKGPNAGQGIKAYTSHGSLKTPHDLHNWKWIQASNCP